MAAHAAMKRPIEVKIWSELVRTHGVSNAFKQARNSRSVFVPVGWLLSYFTLTIRFSHNQSSRQVSGMRPALHSFFVSDFRRGLLTPHRLFLAPSQSFVLVGNTEERIPNGGNPIFLSHCPQQLSSFSIICRHRLAGHVTAHPVAKLKWVRRFTSSM